MAIKILIADDQKMIRQALRNLIKKEPDIEVIGEAEDGLASVKMAEKLMPDVILMDVVMPGLSGIEATRRIKIKFPSIKIIAFSIFLDKELVREMLKAGASAYLAKEDMVEEWLKAVKTVLADQIYISQSLANNEISAYIEIIKKNQ
ncbi:MAG: response regulator transcription factor [Candidatus Aminicenantales bacterium]